MTSHEILRHFVEETQQRDIFTKSRIDRMFTRWRVQKDKANMKHKEERFKAKVVRHENPVPKIAALPRDHVCECGQSYGSVEGLVLHRRLKHGN